MGGIARDEDAALAPFHGKPAFKDVHGRPEDIHIVFGQPICALEIAIGGFARRDALAVDVGIDLEVDADDISTQRDDRMGKS